MSEGAAGQFHARPPRAANLSGRIAEVWQGDQKIGLLFQWSFIGSNGDWEGDAVKYRFQEQPSGGEIEVRLFMGEGSAQLELRARGHIVKDVIADGEMHREALRLKGTQIEVA